MTYHGRKERSRVGRIWEWLARGAMADMGTNHITWPVNLSFYNLPPGLCMKLRYIILAILI
jgi:hypothetical protein